MTKRERERNMKYRKKERKKKRQGKTSARPEKLNKTDGMRSQGQHFMPGHEACMIINRVIHVSRDRHLPARLERRDNADPRSERERGKSDKLSCEGVEEDAELSSR